MALRPHTIEPGTPARSVRIVDLFRNLLNSVLTSSDGASVEELTAEIASVVGGPNSTPGFVRAVQHLRATALDGQSESLNHRRRETELRALFEVAQDLMSSNDFSRVLEEIVGSTQRLIGSDLAHLNLIEDRDLARTLRVTSGALSEEFPSQSTSPTKGITGIVLKTKKLYVSSECLTDSRIEHDPDGDQALSAEWLVTVAGYPLIHEHEVLGVLMVGWRARKEISPDQLILLGSLASLAALAIVGSRLTQEYALTVQRLQNIREEIETANAELEQASAVHDSLSEVLLRLPEIAEFAASLSELVRGDVAIVGPDGEILADALVAGSAVPMNEILEIDLEVLKQWHSSPGVSQFWAKDGSRIWVSPAIARDELLGAVLVRRGALLDSERRTVERMGIATALLLLTQRVAKEAEATFTTEIVEDLTRGLRLERATRQALSMGTRLGQSCVVLVTASFESGRNSIVTDTVRLYAREQQGIAGRASGHIAAIIPGTDPDELAARLAAKFELLGSPLAIGVSEPVSGPEGISQGFEQARMWFETYSRLERTGPATLRSLGFVGALLGRDTAELMRDFVSRTLDPVLRQDETHGTQLVATLKSYFRHGSSLKAAAQELHVHPNTVLQRLQRVAHLLDIDLHDSSSVLEIQLALQVEPLTTSAPRKG